jgi:hypothetical protein
MNECVSRDLRHRYFIGIVKDVCLTRVKQQILMWVSTWNGILISKRCPVVFSLLRNYDNAYILTHFFHKLPPNWLAQSGRKFKN